MDTIAFVDVIMNLLVASHFTSLGCVGHILAKSYDINMRGTRHLQFPGRVPGIFFLPSPHLKVSPGFNIFMSLEYPHMFKEKKTCL